MDDIRTAKLKQSQESRWMETSFHDHFRGAVAAKRATVWIALVVLTVCMAASGASILKPTVISLPAGVTSTEIQKALDSLPDAGGEVLLPAGKFKITQPIVLSRSHQTLSGAGAATILHLGDKADCPVIIMGVPVNHPDRIVQDLCVSGLFIDGNRIHQDRELWRLEGEGSEIRNNGITVQGVSGSSVENVITARCRSGGLVTTLNVRHLTVNGFESYANEFDGLACYETRNCTFKNLNLHDNPGAGISLDLSFNDNVVSNATLSANDLGIFMRSSSENQFYDVVIRGSHHYGVFMAHSEELTAHGWAPMPKSECTDNAFTNLVAANCGGAAFRVNNVTCTRNVLVRAKFDGNLNGGLSLAQPDLLTVR